MKVVFIFLISFLFGCNKNEKMSNFKIVHDTIIAKELIPDEIAVFPGEKKYFAIIKNDTLSFSCIFSKIDSNKISLKIENDEYRNTLVTDSAAVGERSRASSFRKVSYREKMKILGSILKEANKDFNLQNLYSINFGELTENVELAAEVTNDYTKNYGNKISQDYSSINLILQNSSLKRDFTNILKPYSLSIKEIGVENLFFIDKNTLLMDNFKGSISNFPNRILNGSVYIKVISRK